MANKIILKNGDCLEIMKGMDEGSVDLIFADPPYNLSGKSYLTVKSGKSVVLDKGDWDKIDDIHDFNYKWIKECVRVLKPTGTIWISGTLHNHPSVGVTLKNLGLWIINDVVWYKPNATPLLSKNRFAPSTEIIWVASKDKKYYFNYDLAKKINLGKQMKNLWVMNAKRHITIHPTEKPEELIERIVSIGSKEGDLVLDPFLGSGTTGVIAKKLGRNFVGIEIDKGYFDIAQKRINLTPEKLELESPQKDWLENINQQASFASMSEPLIAMRSDKNLNESDKAAVNKFINKAKVDKASQNVARNNRK